jgi:ubiquinone/menaquinone biosynthesis C-methylase UbiE
MRNRQVIYSEEVVQKVNELYHNLINENFDRLWSHKETFELEKKRWNSIGKSLLKNFKGKIIDIGTGTGFVPLNISRYLNKNSTFICSDISEEILKVAKKKIEKRKFNLNFQFRKIVPKIPYELPFATNSANLITINSVIHHIKNTNNFLSEIERVLKKDGLLIIGHEPNYFFYKSSLLYYNFLLLKHLLHPRYTLNKIRKKISSQTPDLDKFNYNNIVTEINERLFKENLISETLDLGDIKRIIDIKAQIGFRPEYLFPEFKILYLDTYNHISWISFLDKKPSSTIRSGLISNRLLAKADMLW